MHAHKFTRSHLLSGTRNDGIQALKENPAVPMETLSEIWEWKKAGISEDDCLERLSLRTVPSEYTLCPWSGMSLK